MERWLIELSAVQLEQLPRDQLELGTLVSGLAGEHYLVFHDSFVALKVASTLGVRRSPGRTLPASAYNGAPLAELGDGSVLVADPR